MMDRLTWRRPGDNVVCPRVPKDSDPNWVAGEFTQEVYNRLAAYEDTGVEPKDVKGLLSLLELMQTLLDEKHLVAIPRTIGDTVYPAGVDPRYEAKVIGAGIDRGGVWMEWAQYCDNVDDPQEFWDGGTFYASDIGKTVFLSREEAEASLKEG